MTDKTHFIPFEIDESHKDSHGSGLLFVDCSHRGNAAPRDNALIHRHVALRSVNSRPAQQKLQGCDLSNQSAIILDRDGDNRPLILKFRAHGRAQASTIPSNRQRTKRHRIKKVIEYDEEAESAVLTGLISRNSFKQSAKLSPYNSLSSPSDLPKDVISTTVEWFFHDIKPTPARNPMFNIAADHWIRGTWQWAMNNEMLFEGLALNTMKKSLDLAGQASSCQDQFICQKVRLIGKLKEQIEAKGSDLDYPSLFIIANLAIVAFQDGDVEAALTHLHALESIDAASRVPAYEWMGLWLIDIRLAMIMGTNPIFRYRRQAQPAVSVLPSTNDEAITRTIECCSLLPQSDEYQSKLEGMFRQLWQFYLAWPQLAKLSTEPFDMIYDMEYSLRLIHATATRTACYVKASTDIHKLVELVVIAAQFSIWIAARFWEPVGFGARMFLIQKALNIVCSTENLASKWMDCKGSPLCLIWILSLITAINIDEGDGLIPVELLTQLLSMARITTKRQFLREMNRWPWLENWHRTRIGVVWDELHANRASKGQKSENELQSQGTLPSTRICRRLFLGTVEFYNA